MAHLFQFMTPARKLTHPTKSDRFWLQKRHEFWEHHNYSSLWTRESSKSNPERQEFQENALIDLCNKCPQIRKVLVFPEFRTFRTMIQMHSLTPSNTNQLITFGEHLVTHFSYFAYQLLYIRIVVP